MDVVWLVLRLIHIIAGVLWVGGTFMILGYVEPTARAAGPEGGRFFQRLAQGGVTVYLGVVALVTTAAGLVL